jgi:hypothetical protein
MTALFKPSINKANDVIIVAEIDGEIGPGFRILYPNETFTKVFGYSAEEAL